MIPLARRPIVLATLVVATAAGCTRHSSHQVSQSHVFASDPHIALDGSGHGVGIWTQDTQDPVLVGLDPPGGAITITRFDAALGFELPVEIFSGYSSYSPRIGMHADGSARAAWMARVGSPSSFLLSVFAATMAPDGVWTNTVVQPAAASVGPISLATNRRGDALLAWWANGRIFAAVAPAGLAWQLPPLDLGGAVPSDPSVVPSLCAAIGPFGEGVVVYSRSSGGVGEVVAHQLRPGFDPLDAVPVQDALPIRLEFEGAGNQLAATVDQFGIVTAAWITDVDGDRWEVASNRFEPPIGWDGARRISDAETTMAEVVLLGSDLSGAVLAEWLDGGDLVRASFVVGTGGGFTGWLAPEEFATQVGSWSDLAVAPNGCAIAVGSTYRLFGAPATTLADVRPPNVGWSGVRSVPESGSDPDADIEESGLAVALSLQELPGQLQPTTEIVVVAQVWQQPLVEIEAPSLATVGVPVHFSAGSTSAGSTGAALAQYDWDFDGDGVFDATFTDESGRVVDHTYDMVGEYDVQLHVRDEWGYAGRAFAHLTVNPGDGPPWRLLVQERGGTGVVKSDLDSDGDGHPDIDCPADCEELYADGVYVYLKATASADFRFDHWEGLASDDMDYGGGECVIHMSAHKSVTAVFSVP